MSPEISFFVLKMLLTNIHAKLVMLKTLAYWWQIWLCFSTASRTISRQKYALYHMQHIMIKHMRLVRCQRYYPTIIKIQTPNSIMPLVLWFIISEHFGKSSTRTVKTLLVILYVLFTIYSESSMYWIIRSVNDIRRHSS